VKLTLFSKLLITAIVLGAIGIGVYKNPDFLSRLAPKANPTPSNVPPTANLPGDGTGGSVAASPPGCADKPEMRFFHWAWNAQIGLIYATGGKQATEGSLMCKEGVNLKLVREDNTDQMQNQLLLFAEALKKGEAHPKAGAHFVAIMGDGSATFLKAVNDRLGKLGPEYIAQVVGSAGYSRGEDKFMGPKAWKDNPQAARGGLVAGVLRDGDWNIALKWLGDNKIKNNPDEKSYDPDALNWVAASDYLDAGEKYISGFCTDLKNLKTGKAEKKCVSGVVTWTPGDVNVATKKGGLVSIVSTKEYRSQMPNVIIGIKKWMKANPKLMEGMLRATFAGGDAVKGGGEALSRGAGLSALVYAEKDGAYWERYYKGVTEKDKTGVDVELGGSTVNNLADNLQLFGLAPGSTNLFAATYNIFGNIVKSQYPDLVPSFPPVSEILDTSYVRAVAGGATEKAKTDADLPKFSTADKVEQVVSRKSWDIQFDTGKATFTPHATETLKTLFGDLVVAGGTLVQIHGHTDNQGSPAKNQQLSEDRAFAVKKWLEKQSSANFPEGRITVIAHGQMQPIESNSSADGRAKNRRVEIVLGTTGLARAQ